jgi:hypothetical protein
VTFGSGNHAFQVERICQDKWLTLCATDGVELQGELAYALEIAEASKRVGLN